MAWLSLWDSGLGREVEPVAPLVMPPREAALGRWYAFLDTEKSRADKWLRRGLITAQEYGLRLDELGELEASLCELA